MNTCTTSVRALSQSILVRCRCIGVLVRYRYTVQYSTVQFLCAPNTVKESKPALLPCIFRFYTPQMAKNGLRRENKDKGVTM